MLFAGDVHVLCVLRGEWLLCRVVCGVVLFVFKGTRWMPWHSKPMKDV